MTQSIVVYGAGAVGCFLGGKLSLPFGHDVTLIGRPAVVDAVAERGLFVREGGESVVVRPRTVPSIADAEQADLVILTVRAYDVAASLDDLCSLLAPGGAVLAMQNGVGSDALLIDALGRDRVLAGTLTAAVDMTAPGDVTRRGRGGIALARVDGSTVPARIAALFQTAGFQTVTVDDWRALRWSKLLLNMVTAATSAILDMSTADIVSHARLFRIEQLAFREAGRVMVANGVQTISLPAYPVPLMRLAMRLPCPLAQRVLAPRIGGARRGGSPGTRGEIVRGRSEIPYRNGAVANEALRLGLHAPVNAALTGIVGEILEHPERRDDFRGHPETLIRSLRERGVMA